MPKVLREQRGTAFGKRLVSGFWAALGKLDAKERVYFLDKILTPTEKLMLAKRLATLKELEGGSSYAKITGKFKIVSNTIWRMSDILQNSPKLRTILGKIDMQKRASNQKKNPKSSPRRRSTPKGGQARKVSHPRKIWFT